MEFILELLTEKLRNTDKYDNLLAVFFLIWVLKASRKKYTRFFPNYFFLMHKVEYTFKRTHMIW